MIVRWTALAQAEFNHQIDYIAADSLPAAIRIRDVVLRHTEMLAENPALGRAGRKLNTRELVIAGTRYIAIYRIRIAAVEILRFLHGAQRFP